MKKKIQGFLLNLDFFNLLIVLVVITFMAIMAVTLICDGVGRLGLAYIKSSIALTSIIAFISLLIIRDKNSVRLDHWNRISNPQYILLRVDHSGKVLESSIFGLWKDGNEIMQVSLPIHQGISDFGCALTYDFGNTKVVIPYHLSYFSSDYYTKCDPQEVYDLLARPDLSFSEYFHRLAESLFSEEAKIGIKDAVEKFLKKEMAEYELFQQILSVAQIPPSGFSHLSEVTLTLDAPKVVALKSVNFRSEGKSNPEGGE